MQNSMLVLRIAISDDLGQWYKGLVINDEWREGKTNMTQGTFQD